MASLPAVGRSALADFAYAELCASILGRRTIAPGARLNIDQLSRTLQMSPTPVREALARAEADGLVVKRPRTGYIVTPIMTRHDLIDLYDVRLRIEPWLAEQAARRPAELRSEELEGLDAGPSHQAGLDREFHDRIAKLAGNEVARQMLRRLNSHFHIHRYLAARGAAGGPGREHQRVADAVRAGDASTARTSMRRHLSAARDRLAALPE